VKVIWQDSILKQRGQGTYNGLGFRESGIVLDEE
ncbi:hypothetical protein Tco_0557332, partial [Tanacetum coccineum]